MWDPFQQQVLLTDKLKSQARIAMLRKTSLRKNHTKLSHRRGLQRSADFTSGLEQLNLAEALSDHKFE